MVVYIKAKVYDEIVQYSMSAAPYEACGLIIGSIRECIEAASFIPLANRAANPRHHFIMNPQEMIPWMMNVQHSVIGIFHSHPTAPPTPSKEDLDTLWHTIPTHWILSLQSPSYPELQIYQIKKAPRTSSRKLSFVVGQ